MHTVDTLQAKLKNKDVIQNIITVSALLILVIFFSCMSEYFFTPSNLMSIMLTATSVGLIAIGQTLCLLSRNFDMSVGNVAAMGGVIFSVLIKNSGWGVFPAFCVGMSFGVASGLVAGLCVSKLKTNSWITTFAMMQIYRGILYILTAGMPVSMPTNAAYRFLGTYKVFGAIQLPILILVVAYLGFSFMLKYTKLGRAIYCIGNNPDAAHINGIHVANTMTFCFVIIGALSALAGILFASRVNSAQPNVGAMYAMDSIAAAVVGGTAMSGGRGTLYGTLIGVLIVNVIQNGLIMIGMDAYYQYIATGLIMFVAVLVQTERTKK